jgi:exodeoxyribonuclease VII large subunit
MSIIAQNDPGDNAPPFTVSAVSAALKRHVEDGFGHVRVRGEISGFKRPASGHLYFALKDENAVLDAVMWKGNAVRIPFAAEDGLDVIVTGKLTTYPGRSKYQIVVDSMELAGEGALLALLEKLKARLASEGLFAAERKRALPYLPRVIGVVTSPTGAVIRDILHRLADRCPTHVILWPVLVQGDAAPAQITAAVRGFGALAVDGDIPKPDLLIVARGGGSIEDLWAFNDESVVRAVAESPIPVISAVGHETDTTLCDFAADMRAPTPTAAAEMAVPVRADLLATLQDLGLRSARAMQRSAAQRRERIDMLGGRLPPLDRLLMPQRQRLDDAGDRLPRALQSRLTLAQSRFAPLANALHPRLLIRQVERRQEALSALWRLAQSLDPRALLSRGYAMVQDGAGRVVTSAAAAGKEARLSLLFADGQIGVRTDAADGDAGPSALAKPTKQKIIPKATNPKQDDLFG